jgi:hypothetical protein
MLTTLNHVEILLLIVCGEMRKKSIYHMFHVDCNIEIPCWKM